MFLGTDGATYRFLSRFGVYVFFAGTAVAQLLTVVASKSLYQQSVIVAQRVLVYTMLVLGPLNLLLKSILENSDNSENLIEWYFVLFLCLFFILSGVAWSRSGRL